MDKNTREWNQVLIEEGFPIAFLYKYTPFYIKSYTY